jgi:hypothetical protein
MAFVKTPSMIGKKVILTRERVAMSGKFEVGSVVTIVAEDEHRGYTLRDDDGNQLRECGWGGYTELGE